jgi:hypothetical protein
MASNCASVTKKKVFFPMFVAFYLMSAILKFKLNSKVSEKVKNASFDMFGFLFRGLVGVMLIGFIGNLVWRMKDGVEYLLNSWLKKLEALEKKKNQ